MTASADNALPILNPRLTKHIGRVHEALNTLKNHRIFEDLETMEPLKIADGGTLTPFVQKDCTTVLTSQKDLPLDRRTGYGPCAINGMWINHTWLVNHRVDRIDSQLESIKKTHYPYNSPPASATHICHIAVNNEKFPVADHKGGLFRISPEELIEVILFSTEEAITKKCSDGILEAWRNLWLTIPAIFELHVTGDDMHWRGQNLREKMVDIGISVKRTVRQRITDVAGFKKDLESDGVTEVGLLLS